MSRFEKFTHKISHINFHEIGDKTKTVESFRNLLIAEHNNYLETIEIVPLPIRKQLST